MVIVDESERPKIRFNLLKCGTPFNYDGYLYMKTVEMQEIGVRSNVVCLTNGTHHFIEDHVLVERVNVKIVIDGEECESNEQFKISIKKKQSS